MKTMIANAEKLEKLGELIEVDGNNVAFGGNVEIDGTLIENGKEAIEKELGLASANVQVDLLSGWIYMIIAKVGSYTFSTSIAIDGNSNVYFSSITWSDEHELRAMFKYTASTRTLQLLSNIGDTTSNYSLDEDAPIIIKPLIAI